MGRVKGLNMAKRTKLEIAEVTRQLLKEKALNKITVKEITSRCGLTRNSFYYYYQDIYDVVNFIFEDEVESLIDRYAETNEWEAGFLSGINYLYENKDMVYHIFHTMQHENIDMYLGRMIDGVIFRLIEHTDEADKAGKEPKKIAALVYRSAFQGVIQQWIADDMGTPPEAIAVLCDEIFRATLLPVLQSSQHALDTLDMDAILK